MNYLRGCDVQLPNDVREINELTEECEYFQIQGLISMMQESRKQKKKRDVIIIEQRIGRITGTCDLSFLQNLFSNDPLFEKTGITWASKNEIAMPFVLSTKQKANIFALLLQYNFTLEGTRRLEMKGEGFDNAEYIFAR